VSGSLLFRLRLVFVVLSMLSCGREVSTTPSPKIPRAVNRVASVQESALIRQCRQLTGWRVRRASAKDKPPVDIVMPPTITDTSVDTATRRLQALRAIDILQEQLREAPHNPHLHFAIGWIHQYSFENRVGAERHFCGAVLADRSNRKYRETLQSVWLAPGMETQLVGSLEPSQRRLPWREVRESVLSLNGVDDRGRARVFSDAINAMEQISRARSLRTERVRWSVSNPITVLRDWALEGGATDPTDLLAAVIVRKSHRKRFDFLQERASPSVPSSAWMVSDAAGRGVLYARGPTALETVFSLVRERLSTKNITLALACGTRGLYIVGQLEEAALKVSRFGAKPDAVSIRAAVAR